MFLESENDYIMNIKDKKEELILKIEQSMFTRIVYSKEN